MSKSLDLAGRSLLIAIYRWTRFMCRTSAVVAMGVVFIAGSHCGPAAADERPTGKPAATVIKAESLPVKADSLRDADAMPQRSAADTERLRLDGYLSHEHSVTISGRVMDEAGEPVSGARVIVVPVIPMGTMYDTLKPIAEGLTNAQGEYRLEGAKISVLEFAPKAVPRPSEALFQVFVVAEGYGYAWRRTRAYRPERRPAGAVVEPVEDEDEEIKSAKTSRVFFADEPIEIDLKVSPEVRVHGNVRDDLGNPLQGAVVQLGYISHSRGLHGNGLLSSNGGYVKESTRGGDGQFEGYFALPEEFRMARTDAKGAYEIRGVPRDCNLGAVIDYLPEYDPWRGKVLTSETASPEGRPTDVFVGYEGELNREFIAPATIRVRVLGAARQPLDNVVVRVESAQRVRRAGTLDRTDADGVATLKLQPGKATIVAEPAIGVGYLPASQPFVIKTSPRDATIELELERAAEVIFEAIEKETGKPVPGVAFLSEPTDGRERKQVQSQISFVDYPRTDVSGRLQAFFAPESRRFFVDQKRSSSEYEPISPTTEAIELQRGNAVTVRFEFTRRPVVANPATQREPVVDELKPLEELLLKQASRFEQSRCLKIQFGHTNHVETTMTQEQITELLESFSAKSYEACLEDLQRSFGIALGARETLISDGVRRRLDSRYSPEFGLHVNVFNGEDMIFSMGNEQLDIYSRASSNLHFLDLHDFWQGPARVSVLAMPKQAVGKEPPQRTIQHVDGNWVIDIASSEGSARRVIDDSTGLERRVSFSMPRRKFARDTWQFFPIALPTGIAIPKLSIAIDYQNGKPHFRNVVCIASVEVLDKLPADAFVVGAPAGTNILDYRGMSRDGQFERRAPSGVITADIPDVVAYRNRFAPAAEPVLKPGDKAPDLNVVTWLDAAGKADRPDLAGKIVVIDFWGINCGPCIAALPEVNAAAKHFADSEIVVIGLHDSSGTLESVSEFANKRGLVFPIAIDSRDPKQQSFGATCSAFGVHGIPTCVVIDRDGRVAYIGQFNRAIEAANQLVIKK